MMHSLYIVFEGIIGTGKSTQARMLYEYLKEKHPGKEIILTREPGGSKIAEAIRKIVQGTSFDEKMEPICEAYLYAASRAQTLRAVVKPVLDRGGIVISDRSFISSLTYQGAARGIGYDKIMEINRLAIDDILPDIIFFIELEPEIALKRCFDREGDKFEKEGIAFFREIWKGYKEISNMEQFRERWINIEGSGTKREVFSRISAAISGI